MTKNPQEWLTQAEYDFQTAEYMTAGGRHVYAVFMAHLAVEKALKGIYQKKNLMPYRPERIAWFIL